MLRKEKKEMGTLLENLIPIDFAIIAEKRDTMIAPIIAPEAL